MNVVITELQIYRINSIIEAKKLKYHYVDFAFTEVNIKYTQVEIRDRMSELLIRFPDLNSM